MSLTRRSTAKIAILGAGAWGTAVAIALARRHQVLLWGRNAALMQAMRSDRENRSYLPGFRLPESLRISAGLDEALAHVDGDPAALLLIASSVAGLRPLTEQLKLRAPPNLVWLCKGLEAGTSMLPHQVVRDVLGQALSAGALYGPSFAQELAEGKPCALTVASAEPAVRARVVEAIHGGAIRVYSTDDIVGVETGGAVKNILAVATGITDGLGLGQNARAALITRGLAEITRLGVAMGGRAETLMGLAGIGDLILTCTGGLSRNRMVGLGLAQGRRLDAIVSELGHVAEGVRCVQAVCDRARSLGVDMPISNAVRAIAFDAVSPRALVQRLLARDPRDEFR